MGFKFRLGRYSNGMNVGVLWCNDSHCCHIRDTESWGQQISRVSSVLCTSPTIWDRMYHTVHERSRLRVAGNGVCCSLERPKLDICWIMAGGLLPVLVTGE